MAGRSRERPHASQCPKANKFRRHSTFDDVLLGLSHPPRYICRHAAVAKLVDAADLGSAGKPCGFKSLRPHQLLGGCSKAGTGRTFAARRANRTVRPLATATRTGRGHRIFPVARANAPTPDQSAKIECAQCAHHDGSDSSFSIMWRVPSHSKPACGFRRKRAGVSAYGSSQICESA